MKSVLAFLTFVALSQAGVPSSRELEGRIINGKDVKVGEIPYQVSVQIHSTNTHYCGGSVLNEYYVITVASCVDYTSARDIHVFAGSVNLDEQISIHRVVQIIIHEQYRRQNTRINDIALLKVDIPFVISETLKYVTLPEPGQGVPANAVAVISGWGQRQEGGQIPRKLQRAETLIVDHDNCTKTYAIQLGVRIHKTQICSYNPDVPTGPCKGDLGSPLTINGKIVGLASMSIGCANVKYPTIYTRVPDYINWIEENAF